MLRNHARTHRFHLGCFYTSFPRRCRERCGGGGGGGGGRGPPAAADAERRLLHGGAEEGEDAQQRPGPAAPAHAQVLHQRTLLQPQGHRLPTSYLQTQGPSPPGGGPLSHVLSSHDSLGPSGNMYLISPLPPFLWLGLFLFLFFYYVY